MIQNFTPNDVLLATTGELSEELQSLLKVSLHEDADLDAFSSALHMIEQEMDNLIPATDEDQVQKIIQRVRAMKKTD